MRSRRSFSPRFKRRVLRELERRADEAGVVSAILKREGLSWSTLARWREEARVAEARDRATTTLNVTETRLAAPEPDGIIRADVTLDLATLTAIVRSGRTVSEVATLALTEWAARQRVSM